MPDIIARILSEIYTVEAFLQRDKDDPIMKMTWEGRLKKLQEELHEAQQKVAIPVCTVYQMWSHSCVGVHTNEACQTYRNPSFR